MASKIKDRVLELTGTTGIESSYVLLGAQKGYTKFDAPLFVNGDAVEYAMTNGRDYEIGQGALALSGATRTITPTLIRASSNGNQRVDWPSGKKRIWSNIAASVIQEIVDAAIAAGANNVPGVLDPSAAPYHVDMTGATSSSTALQQAMSDAGAQRKRIQFGTPGTVRLDVAVNPPGYCVMDLTGVTIKPTGATGRFLNSIALTAAFSTTVSGGATLNSRNLTLAGGSGLIVPGMWYRVFGSVAPVTEEAGTYPSTWGKVDTCSGTALVLDTPLSFTYAGTVGIEFYSSLYERLEVRNGTIDGSATSYNGSTGQAIRCRHYEKIVLENVEFKDFSANLSLTCPVTLFFNVDVWLTGIRSSGGKSTFQLMQLEDCRFIKITGIYQDGSAFGISMTRVVDAQFIGNTMYGRCAKENTDLGNAKSVRGIKTFGCSHVQIIGNDLRDYESAIKVEASHRFIVAANQVVNCGIGPYTGQVALNVSTHANNDSFLEGLIVNNVVEGCGGNAIALTGVGGPNVSSRRCSILGNIVRKCGATAIYSDVPDLIVKDNQVSDWGTLTNDTTYAGIKLIEASSAHIVKDNKFHNGVNIAAPCLEIDSTGAKQADNVCSTANPLSLGSSPTAQPCCVYIGTTQDNLTGDGTAAPVVFDQEMFDDSALHSVSSGFSRFTAPVAGFYELKATLMVKGVDATHRKLAINVNHRAANAVLQSNRDFGGIEQPAPIAGTGGTVLVTCTGSSVFKMSANDYIELALVCLSSGKTVGIFSNGTSSGNRKVSFASLSRLA